MSNAFKLAVGQWGMSAREFWRLTLEEFMWLWELRRPAKVFFANTPNAMTEDELAELAAITYGE